MLSSNFLWFYFFSADPFLRYFHLLYFGRKKCANFVQIQFIHFQSAGNNWVFVFSRKDVDFITINACEARKWCILAKIASFLFFLQTNTSKALTNHAFTVIKYLKGGKKMTLPAAACCGKITVTDVRQHVELQHQTTHPPSSLGGNTAAVSVQHYSRHLTAVRGGRFITHPAQGLCFVPTDARGHCLP